MDSTVVRIEVFLCRVFIGSRIKFTVLFSIAIPLEVHRLRVDDRVVVGRLIHIAFMILLFHAILPLVSFPGSHLIVIAGKLGLLLVAHHLDPVTIDYHISQILLLDLQMRHLLLGLSHLLRI